MSEPKQVIVVRRDLKMRKGKLAAQVAHASMAVLLNLGRHHSDYPDIPGHEELIINLKRPALKEWLSGSFTKIVVGINSEAELLALRSLAEQKGILHALITDSGRTEFHGVPTHTCLALGPDYPDEGRLKEHIKDVPVHITEVLLPGKSNE